MKRLIFLLSLCATLTSCFKEGYDLGDLDTSMEIAIKDTFWLPLSSSGELLVGKFITQNDVVRFEKGADGKEFYALRIDNKGSHSGKYDVEVELMNVGNTTLKRSENPDAAERDINIGDMPDFLHEDGVVLDIDNPMVLLEVENGVPADIEAEIILHGYDKDGKKMEEQDYTIKGIKIKKGSGVQKLYLAESEYADMPAPFKDYVFSSTPEVRRIVRRIPDRITIEIGDVTTTNADVMTLGQKYDIKMNFGVYAPLKFCKDFRLVYNYETDSFGDDLEVIEDLSVDNAVLQADVESALPLDLDMTFTPCNAAGQPIVGLKPLDVRGVKMGEKNVFSYQLISKGYEGGVMDFLDDANPDKKLDHFLVHSVAVAGENESQLIRPDMYVRLVNVKIGLVGTSFSFDPQEEDDEDDDYSGDDNYNYYNNNK